MSIYIVLLGAVAYIGVLFFTAWRVDRYSSEGRRSIVNNPYIYSLSLAVYCTAWTFFGSVGRASTGGLSFLPIYLGPTLTAPLWFTVLRKMIVISKHQRLTSIADFISARYGKSNTVATAVTIIAVLGIIPYISIQLKAVTTGIDIITAHHYSFFTSEAAFYLDASFWVTAAMILFTVLFGTRKTDPNERHEGLVAAVALESVIKLLAFWVIGIFVLYFLYGTPRDLFEAAWQNADTRALFSLKTAGVSDTTWNVLMLLSGFAIILLPRQFHISVVENIHPRHVNTAMWMLPLYLLLINVFVFPIALAGKMLLPSTVTPDTFVLSLPMSVNADWISLLVFIGGFSAATSMVIVSSTALSIMISNHIIIPVLLKLGRFRSDNHFDGGKALLQLRRFSIIAVMMIAYLYLRSVGQGYDLVSVGLISFTAVAQFAPATFAGMYWKGGTRQGAMAGLVAGFVVWVYTLPLTTLAKAGYISADFVQHGLWGIHWLRPNALFGLEGMDAISNAAFWSLFFNTLLYFGVSLFSRPSALTLAQADLYLNIHRYTAGQEYDVMRRAAKMSDLLRVMNRFLGMARVDELIEKYNQTNAADVHRQTMAEADLINYFETHLSGAIGAASARVVMESISKEEYISLEEVMQVLEQTREVMQYSRALEAKSAELEATTLQLTEANNQLKALDQLKADFITTVTHELRTPVTSIKSLSKIILDYREELSEAKLNEYLTILVSESDRISRLINQVLDIEKIRAEAHSDRPMEPVQLNAIIQSARTGMEQMFRERNIECKYYCTAPNAEVSGHKDRLTQVVINLMSNAYKFCDQENGLITLRLDKYKNYLIFQVKDNGAGIPPDAQELIFGQFTQLQSGEQGKPQGTGLGLFITRQIVQQHQGVISVESRVGEGATFKVRLPIV